MNHIKCGLTPSHRPTLNLNDSKLHQTCTNGGIMTISPPLKGQRRLPLTWGTADPVPRHEVPPRTPELERWIGRICAAIAEAVAGDRPVNQLFRVASPAVLRRLTVTAQVRGRSNAPIRRVTSVRVARINARTIEACAVVQGSRRCQAVAVQLTRRNQGWLVTAAEIR